MPVPTLISQLSTTASLNSPDGAVDVPSSIDDYQRAHAAFIAQLYAGTVAAATVIVPSATTTDIGAAASENVDISGNTTITGFGTVAEGINRKGRFTGVLTLTHNATSLILPGNANITTAANDRYEARSLGGGNWIVTKYQYASGYASETVAGLLEIATAAEAQAFTENKAIDGAKLAAALKGANQSLAASGYQKLPGGLIVQWGLSGGIPSNGNLSVTFPIAFPTACLNVTSTYTNGATDVTSHVTLQVRSISASAVTLRNIGTVADAQFYWKAIGF